MSRSMNVPCGEVVAYETVDGCPDVAAVIAEDAESRRPHTIRESQSARVDAHYFHGKLSQVLRDVSSFTPQEMARALVRLACVADDREALRECRRLNDRP